MKIFVKFLILMFFVAISAKSQDSVSVQMDNIDLSSPYGAVHTHLRFLQENRYQPKNAAAPFKYGDISLDEAVNYARKLKKIMDGRQLYVIMNDVPNDPNYKDTVSGEHIYVLFNDEPWLYVEKRGKNWFYSERTINSIAYEFNKTYPFHLNEIKDYLPDFMMESYFGLQLWQWLGILLYIIIGIILYYILYWIFGYFLIKIFKKHARRDVFSKYIALVAKPSSILIVLLVIMAFLGVLQLPIQMGYYIKSSLKLLYPLILTIIAYRLADFVSDIIDRIASRTQTKIDDHFVPLVRKTLKVTVVILGLIYTVNNLGVDITPLIAGASIGGLAFALAAKDTLSNFFGSITIFSDQPFEIGDWIKFDGGEGTVEDVGVRSSRIRTFYNSQLSIPNGKLSDAVIDNMGRREFRRYFTNIGLTYDTPPDALDAFVEGLRAIVDNHPDTRKDFYQIHLNDFGAYSLNVLFYIFFKVPDWEAELAARHEIISEIIKLAEALGVRFAFPTQTLHMEEMPGQESLSPIYNQSREEFMKLQADFANTQKSKWENVKSRNDKLQG